MGFWVFLVHPIGATIRIGREMLCLPYAGYFNCTIRSKVTVVLLDRANWLVFQDIQFFMAIKPTIHRHSGGVSSGRVGD